MAAMDSIGLTHPDQRPLTQSIHDRPDVIDLVIEELRTKHSHRADEMSDDDIGLIVSKRYLNIEPWAIEPLVAFGARPS